MKEKEQKDDDAAEKLILWRPDKTDANNNKRNLGVKI